MNACTLMSPGLRIHVSCGVRTIVRLDGELDTACTDLVAAAARLLPESAALVTVDLRDLTFIDNAGVDALAALHVLQGVLLANAQPGVERVFGFLGICARLSELPSAHKSPLTPGRRRTTQPAAAS